MLEESTKKTGGRTQSISQTEAPGKEFDRKKSHLRKMSLANTNFAIEDII